MPELISDGEIIKSNDSKETSNIKFWEGDNKDNEDIGLKQIETRKILNYNDTMIQFINNAGSKTLSTDVHNTFR